MVDAAPAPAAPAPAMPDDQVRRDFLVARAQGAGLSAEQQLDALLASPAPAPPGGAPAPAPATAGLPPGKQVDATLATAPASGQDQPGLIRRLINAYVDWWQRGGEEAAARMQRMNAEVASWGGRLPDADTLLHSELGRFATGIGMSIAPGEGAKGTLDVLGIPPPAKPPVGVPGGDIIARAQAESAAGAGEGGAGAAATASEGAAAPPKTFLTGETPPASAAATAGDQAAAARPGAAPAGGAAPGAPAAAPEPAAPSGPAVQIVAKDGTASPLPTPGEAAARFTVSPEARAQAVDYLNGVTGDNPVQASLAHIADPKVMDEAIQGVASFIPKDGVKPDDVLRQAAYATAMQPEDVLAGLKGRLPDDTQIAAWAMLVNSGGAELGALSQRAVESGAPEDWEAAIRAFALQQRILQEWTGAGVEMGRAFRARQLASEARSDYAATVQDIIKNMGSGTAEDVVRKIAALQTPEQASGFAAALRWMGQRDVILSGWYNYLLGPKTVAKKLLTDLSMPFWNAAERFTAEKAGSGAVPAGETAQLVAGYAGAFGDAVRAAGRGLMAGRSQFMSDARTLEGLPLRRAALIANGAEIGPQGAAALQPTRNALAYLRAALPTSWIAGIDDFAKTFHYRAELRALAWRDGVGKFTDGAGNVDYDAAAEHVQDMLASPSPELHMQAAQAAQRLTFTEPLTGVAEKLASVADGFNIPVRGSRFEIPAGRILLPFTRTPANFVRFMYRASPLPEIFPSAAYRAEIAGGGAARDLAYARMGLGTGLAISATALAAGGYITGRGPTDPKLREAWLAAGNQPYSIQVPGARPVSYPTEPFAMTIGALADTVDLMKFAKEEDSGQLALGYALGAGHAFLSRTYMQGLAQFMDAVQNPDREGAAWVRQLATSLAVPRIAGDATAALDRWQRAHYDVMQSIETRIPFLREGLEPLRDRWGDPIPLRDAYLPFGSGTAGAYMVSPFSLGPNPDQVNPIDRWRWEHRADFANGDPGIPKPSMVQSWQQGQGVKANVRLTPQQYDRFVEQAGNGLKDPRTGLGAKDLLNALVRGDAPGFAQREWDQASDAERALMVQRIVGEYRSAARVQLTHEFPDVRDAVQAQWGARRDQLSQRPASAAPQASPASGSAAAMPRLD